MKKMIIIFGALVGAASGTLAISLGWILWGPPPALAIIVAITTGTLMGAFSGFLDSGFLDKMYGHEPCPNYHRPK